MSRVWILLLSLNVTACAGAQSSSGASGATDPATAAMMYAGTIHGCAMSFFEPPAGDMTGLQVNVEVKVDADGTLLEPVILKPSENPDFDAAMIAALEKCKTLPPPPPEAADKLKNEGLKMGFAPPGS